MAREVPKKGAKRPASDVPKPEAQEEKVEVKTPTIPSEITIERRTEVARIKVSEDGVENAITLAFQTAAEYIVAHLKDGEPTEMELEFSFQGLSYYAGVTTEGNA